MKKKGFISILLGIFILAFAILAPVFADAADMMFVKIEGIPGESTDVRHMDWIEAFGFGDSILMTPPVSGGGSGRSEFGPVKFLKSIDKASPKLHEAVASGEHIRDVEIELTRSVSGSERTYFKITLEDVLITEVSMTTAGELIALSFSKVKWEYTILRPDGSSGGTVTGEWDLVLNRGA